MASCKLNPDSRHTRTWSCTRALMSPGVSWDGGNPITSPPPGKFSFGSANRRATSAWKLASTPTHGSMGPPSVAGGCGAVPARGICRGSPTAVDGGGVGPADGAGCWGAPVWAAWGRLSAAPLGSGPRTSPAAPSPSSCAASPVASAVVRCTGSVWAQDDTSKVPKLVGREPPEPALKPLNGAADVPPAECGNVEARRSATSASRGDWSMSPPCVV